jgi:hypothetical protein
MGETFDYAQMVRLYPGEYVILENAKQDKVTRSISGIVIWHGRDREEGVKWISKSKERNLTLMLCEARVNPKGVQL